MPSRYLGMIDEQDTMENFYIYRCNIFGAWRILRLIFHEVYILVGTGSEAAAEKVVQQQATEKDMRKDQLSASSVLQQRLDSVHRAGKSVSGRKRPWCDIDLNMPVEDCTRNSSSDGLSGGDVSED